MKSPIVLAVLAVTIALAGCAPTGGGGPTADPDPKPTVTVTPEEPTAAAAILSVDGIDVVDEAGATLEGATFQDPEAMLALLAELLGSTPTPTESPEFGTTTWEWPGVLFGSNGEDFSWLRSEAGDLGGLPLQTGEGITIGSTRAEVEALSPFDLDYDMDGDGSSDLLGLEPQPVPGTESLTFPGETGTEFIEVQVPGGEVTVLRAPSNDYSDV
jgi:hypothetical protein